MGLQKDVGLVSKLGLEMGRESTYGHAQKSRRLGVSMVGKAQENRNEKSVL